MNDTDTVPRFSRCSQCGTFVLGAWSAGVHITINVSTLAPDVAQLAFTSGHVIYRVRSTRRLTLAAVRNEDDIIDQHSYLVGHTCTSSDPMSVGA